MKKLILILSVLLIITSSCYNESQQAKILYKTYPYDEIYKFNLGSSDHSVTGYLVKTYDDIFIYEFVSSTDTCPTIVLKVKINK